MPKNWCSWAVVLEKTLESPLDCKEIKAVNLKGNHSWIFIGRTDAEAETPVLSPPDVKNCLIWKDRDAARKDCRQEEKGMAEDEVVGWHLSKPRELVMYMETWHAAFHGSQRVGHDWVSELNWLSDSYQSYYFPSSKSTIGKTDPSDMGECL